ncbi:tyrosine-type recombinase/integrase [Nocardioides sp. SOB77]|uniref:Tyrosine-type recombinase/integrase n=1 Tax=Nocardioides oceani TaxID=3058369 RepID=A0ABT8FJ97_9ACTN|nr:tyrosine-type recombinase/integrase [Nocardioides oceani]MDN4174751.1 tyrosine-type recombinase/integrase [Nocardioides oceani]
MTHATLPLPAAGTDELTMAIISYLGRARSANTFKLYKYHLGLFIDWCKAHGFHPLHDVQRTHIEFYVRHLIEERGLKASSVHTAMTPVKGFYDFAVWDRRITFDPARRVALPKVEHTKKEIVAQRELNLFLEVAKETSPRHHCLVAFLSSMALRISEAASLRFENFTGYERGMPTITFTEKGGGTRTTPVPMPLLPVLERVRNGRDEGPIITQRDGVSPLTRHGATGLVETVNRRAMKQGLTRHINPHLLRAMAITEAFNMNMSVRDVQEFARHADPRTTSRHYDLGHVNTYRHPVHQVAARLAV